MEHETENRKTESKSSLPVRQNRKKTGRLIGKIICAILSYITFGFYVLVFCSQDYFLMTYGEMTDIRRSNPRLDLLTPERIIEHKDIYFLDCDKTDEQILAGEPYTLMVTKETEDLIFRINFLQLDCMDMQPYFFSI